LDGFNFRLDEKEKAAERTFRDYVTGKIPGCGC
jgi:hypothetical protein